MKRQTKLDSSEAQKSRQLGMEEQNQKSATEFSSVEDLLRYDAAQTPLPSGIAQKLGKSVQGLPLPTRSWWQRWFKPRDPNP